MSPALPAGFVVMGPQERRHRAGRVPGSAVDVLLDGETPTTSLLAGINHLAPGGRIPLHHHDYEELQFILSGSGLALDALGGEHALEAGSTVYCAEGPEAAHGFVSTGDVPLAILFVYPTPGGTAPSLTWVE
jgi:quercetin dioxygenase-like cupin family protein